MDTVMLTIDIDWAPDFVIEGVVARLEEYEVCATWFVTHQTGVLERLRSRPDLFELGIHPNFMPGSTHGCSEDEVLEHCLGLVPEARSLRTHGLFSSINLLNRVAKDTPIDLDSSLIAPHAPRIRPFEYEYGGNRLLRVPYFFQDDYEMACRDPIWGLPRLLRIEGLKVFNLHPIHIQLNSRSMRPYQAIKREVRCLTEATPERLRVARHEGVGTDTLFEALLRHLAAGGASQTLHQRFGVPDGESSVRRRREAEPRARA